MSRDPLGLWGDPGQAGNGQNYCGNNPVNRVDPLGLSEIPEDWPMPEGASPGPAPSAPDVPFGVRLEQADEVMRRAGFCDRSRGLLIAGMRLQEDIRTYEELVRAHPKGPAGDQLRKRLEAMKGALKGIEDTLMNEFPEILEAAGIKVGKPLPPGFWKRFLSSVAGFLDRWLGPLFRFFDKVDRCLPPLLIPEDLLGEPMPNPYGPYGYPSRS